jgi:hypothetical protein
MRAFQVHADVRLATLVYMQLTCIVLRCGVLCLRPAEDRKGVKEALVEMTKASRAALQGKQ